MATPTTQVDIANFPEGARENLANKRLQLLEDYAKTQELLDASNFDLDKFMQISVDRLAVVTGAKGIAVELVEGDELVFRACNQRLRQHVGRRFLRSGSLSGLCIEQRKVLICDDAETDLRANQEVCGSAGVRSMLCAPLFGGDGALGVVKLMALTPQAFTAEDGEAVSLTARALGAALGRQLAYAKQAATVRALEEEIEARQRLEAVEKAHQARLSNLIEHAHQAIITVDKAGCIRSWNPFAEVMFGWSASEVLGCDAFDVLIPPEDRIMRRENMKRFQNSDRARSGKRTEWMALRRSGEAFPIEIAINGFEGPDGWEFTGLMHDISERRAKIELFEASFQHAAIGMALVSLDGAFLKVNPTLQEMLGYSEDELLKRDFQSITHPDDLEIDIARLQSLLAGVVPNYRMDKRYFRADGSLVWVRLAVALVFNPDGSPHHFISQIEDLTAQRLAEAALADSERRYRVIAENTSDMIVTTDLRGSPPSYHRFAKPSWAAIRSL